MTIMPIIKGARWRHRKTGRVAVVTSGGVQRVLYQYETPADGARFVQSCNVSVEDFRSRFDPIEDGT